MEVNLWKKARDLGATEAGCEGGKGERKELREGTVEGLLLVLTKDETM